MIELQVYDLEGKKTDTLKIDEAIFGGRVNKSLLRDAILMYQASRRAGTGSAKNRSEVNGSRSKPFKQKGTGRARQGSWIAPQHRGGGVAHGPHARDFSYAIPKKARIAALKSAYLAKLLEGTKVIENMKLEAPKTAQVAGLLKKLEMNKGTCLIATLGHSETVTKSVRNIQGVEAKSVREINTHDLLRRRQLLVTRRALQTVIDRFAALRAESEE